MNLELPGFVAIEKEEIVQREGGRRNTAGRSRRRRRVRPALSFDRLGGLLAKTKSLINSSDTFETGLRDVAAVDSDRYDRDREGRTVRQDDGFGDRQDVVHQESAGLSWD